jgi:potassium/hydrogen antiporter
VMLSIRAGTLSTRIGAPLLLIFLGLGMLAGEDGLGGVPFDDFHATYLVGSIALAVVLFDGGLRTPRSSFSLAMWPALSLATLGILVTAVVAGAFAAWVLGLSPLESLLVGAIVASTDAAAVFLLLHGRGTEISKRVSAALEVESGINDPMAVFLTISCVEILLFPDRGTDWHVITDFVIQMGGGAAIGVAGGLLLVQLINRIEIAAGLYPILAVAVALIVFSGAQVLETSGFLAVYLAGLVLGNRRHRAHTVINRFHDGLAWLAQIVMFLLLGLLVTPSTLISNLWSELAVAVSLIIFARPLAVWICLLPFRFTWQEKAFIAWVGLRGAVPIFLASIPVIAGVANGMVYFNVAFVVVLVSLVVQGWTIPWSARVLGLELPPPPELERQDIDLPQTADREAASWQVAHNSPAIDLPFHSLPLPRRTRIIAVIREGTVMNREALERLVADDYVIGLAPPEQLMTLDRMFAAKPAPKRQRAAAELGEFVFNGDVPLAQLCNMYGLPLDPEYADKTLAEFFEDRLGAVAVGDRLKIGEAELVARETAKGRLARVGLEVEPAAERLPLLRVWRKLFGRS